MAAPTISGTPQSIGNVSSSSLAVNKPSGMADGCIVFLAAEHRVASGTWTVPSGFTAVATNGTNHSYGVWWKYEPTAAGAPSTYTVTSSNAASRYAVVSWAVAGADTTNPIDSFGAGPASGTTQVVLPTLTVTDTDLLLAVATDFFQSTTVLTWTPASGMTEILDVAGGSAGGNTVNIQVATESVTAGSTGTRTPTLSAAATATGGFLIAVRPPLSSDPTFGLVAATATTDGASTGTQVTLAKPTGVKDGDVLTAWVHHRTGAGTWTGPTGWVRQAAAATNSSYALFTKVIPSASAETATSYVFTQDQAGSRVSGVMMRLVGAKQSNPVDVTGYASNSGTTTVVHPAIDPAASDGLLATFSIAVENTASTAVSWTPPSGMTELVEYQTPTAGAFSISTEIAQLALTGSSATAAETATCSPAVTNTGGLAVVFRRNAFNTAPSILLSYSLSPADADGAEAASTVTVTGVTTDPDGDQVTVTWSATSVPESQSVSITSYDQPQSCTFDAPLLLAAGNVTIRAVPNDGTIDGTAATINIPILPCTERVIVAGVAVPAIWRTVN